MAGTAVGLAALATPAAAAPTAVKVVAEGLSDPRGIFADPAGRLLVAESGSGDITQVRTDGSWARGVSTFASLPVDQETGGPVDVARRKGLARLHALWAGKLVTIRRGGDPTTVADIAAYQADDPDPDDLEDTPDESNPNGLALIKRGRTLVADAAGNDLLLIDRRGNISTVARFKPELVPWPEGVDGPPPGTPTPAESVPTAVAVGPDGAWYVSELKGFPFVPGTSRIWRIEPGSTDATCDPERPRTGPCRSFATGFTSVIDLAFGDGGTLYVLEIAKDGVGALESGGNPAGALWAVEDGRRTELAPGAFAAPGGVAVDDEKIYVTTGTVFGPDAGQVLRIHEPDSDDDDRDHDDDNHDDDDDDD